MSITRTPKPCTTPSGLAFAVKPYITGGEMLDISLAGSSGLKADSQDFADGGRPNVKMNFAEMQRAEIYKKIETVVVSVDGSEESVLQRVLELPVADYNAIYEEVQAACTDPKQAK